MNKRYVFFLIFILVMIYNAFTQAPSIVWAKCYGGSDDDEAHAVSILSNGEIIISGTAMSTDSEVVGNNGQRDYWLLRLDSTGLLRRADCFGGTSNEHAISGTLCSNNNIAIAGNSMSSDGDVNQNFGNYDYWILKTDTSGNIIQSNVFGGTMMEGAQSIIQLMNGTFMVAGSTQSNDVMVSGNHGAGDWWILNLSDNFQLNWQHCFGGTANDDAASILQCPDSSVLIVGRAYSNNGDVSGNHGMGDFWIAKLDASGGLIWQKCFGGSGGDLAHSAINTTDGGFLIAGSSFSTNGDVTGNHGGVDYWVVKIDSLGNLEWEHSYGDSMNEEAFSVFQTSDQGFVIGGYTESNDGDVTGNHGVNDFWIIKTDMNGTLEWQKCLGGSRQDYGYSMAYTSNGEIIVAGSTTSDDGDVTDYNDPIFGYHPDVWVVKLAPFSLSNTELREPVGVFTASLDIADNLSIHFSSSCHSIRQLVVTDLIGRNLCQTSLLAHPGDNHQEIPLSNLAKGIYIVTLGGEDGSTSVKISRK